MLARDIEALELLARDIEALELLAVEICLNDPRTCSALATTGAGYLSEFLVGDVSGLCHELTFDPIATTRARLRTKPRARARTDPSGSSS